MIIPWIFDYTLILLLMALFDQNFLDSISVVLLLIIVWYSFIMLFQSQPCSCIICLQFNLLALIYVSQRFLIIIFFVIFLLIVFIIILYSLIMLFLSQTSSFVVCLWVPLLAVIYVLHCYFITILLIFCCAFRSLIYNFYWFYWLIYFNTYSLQV